MRKNDRIYIAGHRGLVGSALFRALRGQGYANLLTRAHAELDLLDQKAVASFFAEEQPDYVFLAAARVGGILANNTYPAEFIHQNLLIQDNILHQSWRNGVKRLLFLGSSCIYPKECPQPILEEYLLTGPLEPTNRPYAIAKIAGIETCWAYNRQYGTRFLAVMPTNLYGPGDNYDLQNSHVLPALIRKMHQAKMENAPSVTAWGTGTPRREFLYSDDLADACLFLVSLSDNEFNSLLSEYHPPLINIGCGEDLPIAELVQLVKEAVGYEGKIEWDRNKPDGTMRKLLDISRLTQLGWKFKTSLHNGIRMAYEDFLSSVHPETATS
jgi:GDP-L-fucose synthase